MKRKKIDCDVFLIDDNGELIDKEKYAECIELSIDVNRFIYNLFDHCNIVNADEEDIFRIVTFTKIHKDFQSTFLLLERGLPEQAKVILRSLLEKLFVLEAVTMDKGVYKKWINSQLHQKLTIYRNIMNQKPGLEHLDVSHLSEKLYDGAKRVYISDWAKLANMESDYNFTYSIFSKNVHLSVEAINEDITCANNYVDVVDIRSKEDDLDKIFATNIHYMIFAIRTVADIFEFDRKNIDDLESRNFALVKDLAII